MKKINIVGTSGSGKSTFGREMATKLSYPYIEMDAIFWLPNWQQASDDAFFSELIAQLEQKEWILDGNYSRTAHIKWANADTVIWIDYSFIRTIYQATKRALIRCITKKELWQNTGNVESFKQTFFSRKSILLWTLQNFKSNRTRYTKVFNDPQFCHIKFIRLTNPKMARSFIQHL